MLNGEHGFKSVFAAAARENTKAAFFLSITTFLPHHCVLSLSVNIRSCLTEAVRNINVKVTHV